MNSLDFLRRDLETVQGFTVDGLGQVFHFLHLGKTGGTALKYALRNIQDGKIKLRLHDHGFTLRQVPVGEKVFFFTRDPVSRYVSGFLSRKRRGHPRYDVPWTDAETIAFSRFATPNELASALSSSDATRQAATEAMRSIGHVKSSYWDWFENEAYLLSRVPDVCFIGFQERLVSDFGLLKSILDLPKDLKLPESDVEAHRNPFNLDKGLEEEAQRNLVAWYAQDYFFLKLCREIRSGIEEMRTLK
jgi:hypothetical protein